MVTIYLTLYVKEFDLRILCFGDNQGQYSCYNWNGNNTVDYFITSKELLDDIQVLEIRPLTEFSMHCPLKLVLKQNFQQQYNTNICEN